MAVERGPHVLVATVTSKGMRHSDDGTSLVVEGIGNWISVSPDSLGPGGQMAIPLYVMATAGKRGQAIRLSVAVDYPDGVRETYPYMEDSSRKVGESGSPVDWRRILTLPYRVPGVHWIRVSLNGSLKTEVPVNVALAEAGADVTGPVARFDA